MAQFLELAADLLLIFVIFLQITSYLSFEVDISRAQNSATIIYAGIGQLNLFRASVRQLHTLREMGPPKVSIGWKETADISEQRCVPVREGALPPLQNN